MTNAEPMELAELYVDPFIGILSEREDVKADHRKSRKAMRRSKTERKNEALNRERREYRLYNRGWIAEKKAVYVA